ncbi:Uncharacterised protein [Serratia proteamaculans]|jgi:hypothetical protein|nr:Uncharacterised protein [Serratia proteamaculans]CAI2492669.1 Uncharacterised protein [Serratia proteamaculans]
MPRAFKNAHLKVNKDVTGDAFSWNDSANGDKKTGTAGRQHPMSTTV